MGLGWNVGGPSVVIGYPAGLLFLQVESFGENHIISYIGNHFHYLFLLLLSFYILRRSICIC